MAGLFDSIGGIGGVLLGAGSIASTAASIFAGNKQADAAKDAQASSAAERAQARQDFAHLRGLGIGGTASLADLMGITRNLNAPVDPSLGAMSGAAIPFQGFEGSPGYQFRLEEGQKAIDNAAAARGMLRSGGRAKAMERYGQGFASNEFGNEFNRRAALAGIGQAATGNSANLSAALTGQANQAGLDAATARGSAFVGGANGINNAFQQFALGSAAGIF
jgi:hypothetical protein